MILIVVWISFNLSMILSRELDQFHYLLFSGFMFYFTYVYNKISPCTLTVRKLSLLLLIPNSVFWYIFFVYNDFLSLSPVSYDFLVMLFFAYTYILIYVFIEHGDTETLYR